MSTFLQLHFLTSYPPACLNRDDLNRPKTAVMGGIPRLRISSQSLKRAWRTSKVFKSALSGHIGTQTRCMGIEVYNKFIEGGVEDENAKNWAKAIAKQFGALDSATQDEPLNDCAIKQLAHFSPEEKTLIDELTNKLLKERREPTADELKLLRKKHKAVDIALFGRMLADAPLYDTEGACEVSHALTVHKVAVEDDYFTAIDDLNTRGAAHIGEQGFAAGLFYLYVCINRDLLMENLSSDKGLADKTIKALVEAAATVAPTGKQKSFASRAWASYIHAEKGTRQPRSLAVAFLKPVKSDDMLQEAIQKLEETRTRIDTVYYGHEKEISLPSEPLNALDGTGTLNTLLNFLIS